MIRDIIIIFNVNLSTVEKVGMVDIICLFIHFEHESESIRFIQANLNIFTNQIIDIKYLFIYFSFFFILCRLILMVEKYFIWYYSIVFSYEYN